MKTCRTSLLFRGAATLLFTFLLILMTMPSVFAEEPYVVSFATTPESVQPGDYFNVVLKIANPSKGETNIAALQANLEYDTSKITYIDAKAGKGSNIAFDSTTKMITAYGEGHQFTDSIDFVTFTFQAADTASGEVSISAATSDSSPILAMRDATEIPAVIGSGATIKIGSDAPESKVKPASGKGTNFTSAAAAASDGNTSNSQGSDQNNNGNTDGADTGSSNNSDTSGSANAGSSDTGSGTNDTTNGSQDGSTASGTAADGTTADGTAIDGTDTGSGDGSLSTTASGDDNALGAGEAETANADSTKSGIPVAAIVIILICAAAAAGGIVYYLRRKKQ